MVLLQVAEVPPSPIPKLISSEFEMAGAQQRMRVANEKATKNITQRGNVTAKPVRPECHCTDITYQVENILSFAAKRVQVPRRTVAHRPLHLRGLRVGHLSAHPVDMDGQDVIRPRPQVATAPQVWYLLFLLFSPSTLSLKHQNAHI